MQVLKPSFNWSHIVIIIMVGTLAYLPTLNLPLLSDDYDSLHKILHFSIFHGNWFRPLTDFSLLINFKIGGQTPFGYHLFNLILHLANTIIAYFLLLRIFKLLSPANSPSKQSILLFSILFLVSFNNLETVSWVVARGALLAYFFMGFSWLQYIKYLENKRIRHTLTSSALFFTSMLAYESTWIFPIILFIFNLLILKELKTKQSIKFITPTLITFAIYLILRTMASSQVIGTYGLEKLTGDSFFNLLLNAIKILSRLVVYPTGNLWLTTSFSTILLLAFIIITSKIIKTKKVSLPNFIMITLMLFVSVMPIIGIGIDSRDGEGGRYLYLPNFFFAITGVFISNYTFLEKLKTRVIIWIAIIYNTVFLIIGHNNWQISGQIRKEVLTELKNHQDEGHILIKNLPGDYNGAFVYRNGLHKNLILNDLENLSGKIHIKNSVELKQNNLTNSNPLELISRPYINIFTQREYENGIYLKPKLMKEGSHLEIDFQNIVFK